MGHGKNAAGSKGIVRAPATKFAQLQKKALKNRKPVKNRVAAAKVGKQNRQDTAASRARCDTMWPKMPMTWLMS